MGATSCVDDYSTHNGDFPQVTRNAQLFLIATAILLIIRAYPYYLENFNKPPSDGNLPKRPSYGLGAISTVKYLCGIGLVLSGPQALLYFIFRWAPGDRSLEFACLAQDSFVSFVVPFVLAYIAFLMILTNALRSKTRHTWAAVAKQYLIPVINHADPSLNHDTHRILFLPVLRGMWCPPIINVFHENVKASGSQGAFQCIAMDSFGSQYCTDTSEWFEVNMKLEHVDQYITTVWTDFSKFPIADNSIDVVCMPAGLFLPYMTDSNVPEEELANRKKVIMSEILRVLKPGGVFLASNITVLVNGWESMITENGFVNIETLSQKLWWTYMPAKMTVSFKKTDDNTESKYCEVSEEIVDKKFVISKDNPSPHVAQARSDNMLLPPGKHWRLVEILCFSTILSWIMLILLVWGFMDSLQTPSIVPYGTQFAALFVSNLTSLPILFFTMFSDLRNVARGFEIDRDNGFSKTTKQSNGSAAHAVHEAMDQRVEGMRTQRILRVYKKQLTYLAYLIGVLTWLSWLPYFFLDLILHDTTSLSLDKVQFINSMVAIGVFFTLIPIVQYISSKIKQKDQEIALEDAKDAQLLQEAQEGFVVEEKTAESSCGLSPLHVSDSVA